MFFRIILLLILIIMLDKSSFAEFKQLAADVYIDKSTIVRNSNNVRCWFMFVNDDKSRRKILYSFDCKDKSSKMERFIEYNKDDKIISDYGAQYSYEYIIPGSYGEAMMNAVCKRRFQFF